MPERFTVARCGLFPASPAFRPRRRPYDPPLSMRQDDRHLNLAAGAYHLERHLAAVAANPKVDTGGAEPQITQHHFVEKSRQPRVAQADLAAPDVEFQTEGSLQQAERRGTGPGLRRAGDGIER